MKLEAFFDNFGYLADAPNSIQKLRELILQLAVQGKLVPQNPKEESAQNLFERLKAERIKFAKSRIVKNATVTEEDSTGEMPFCLPSGWMWVQVKDLGITHTGSTPDTSKREYYGSDYPFVTPANIERTCIKYEDDGLSKAGLEAGRRIEPDSVLMVCIGGSIGKVNYVERVCSCNQQINVLTPFSELAAKLIVFFMRSPYFQNAVVSTAPQTTLPILSKGKWELLFFPLPPLAEQKRIVVKVDKLMALCDELEEQQKNRYETRLHLNNSAIDVLLTSQTPKEFTTNWQRICDNFDMLYNHPDTVDNLRQAILQLAVQGKLGTKDPNDEPASRLLEKIRAEKQKLVRDGKIKALKQLPAMIAEDLPYLSPSNWEWVRLAEIGDITTGSKDVNEGSPTGKYLFFSCAAEPLRSDTYSLEGESLILPGNGANVGLVTYFDGEFELYQRTYVVNNMKIYGKYLYVYLKTYFKQRLEGSHYGSAINYIKIGNLTDFLICVPPLNEQKRIVAKVDQLMVLCDQLQTQLKEAQETNTKFTAAAVSKLIAAEQ